MYLLNPPRRCRFNSWRDYMLYIVLYFAALFALLSWARKSPGPLPRDKITAKITPYKKPKKPPKKRYSKNNITTQVNRKRPASIGCFVLRCFRDRRTVAAGIVDPARFSRVKWESNVNRGWPEREGRKEINQNKSRARTRMRKICAYVCA